jgi:Protein of unknown function (DUF2924)
MQALNCGGGAGSAPPSSQPLEGRIKALADLSILELKAVWSENWGVAPPKGARRRLLMLGIAWKWQAQIDGGFAKPLERRLAALEAGLRQTGAPNGTDHRIARPRRRLMPGNRLIRIWQGERHEVHVMEGGYLWRGRSWVSLSAIAREITGTRRNGPAFFGLRDGEAG